MRTNKNQTFFVLADERHPPATGTLSAHAVYQVPIEYECIIHHGKSETTKISVKYYDKQ